VLGVGLGVGLGAAPGVGDAAGVGVGFGTPAFEATTELPPPPQPVKNNAINVIETSEYETQRLCTAKSPRGSVLMDGPEFLAR